MSNFYAATSLIGGGAGALDTIDGTDLADGDGALVIIDGNAYTYHLDATIAGSEDSPTVISPDANAGDKRWILSNFTALNINAALSSMVLTGGEVSEGTNAGTIKVAALTAMLRTGTGESDPLVKCTLAEQDNITLAAIETQYKILLTYGDPCTIATSASGGNGANIISVGACLKEDDGTRHYMSSGVRLTDGVRKLHSRAAALRSLELSSGALSSDPGTRNILITAGVFYGGVNKFTTTAFNSTQTGYTFDYYYWNPDGSAWVKDDNSGNGFTQIDNVQYNKVDSGTGLANLVANKYTTNWIFYEPGHDHPLLLLGRSYGSLTDAYNEEIPASLPDVLDKMGVLICKIIIQEGSDTLIFQNVKYFTFTPQVSVDHNELQGLQGGAASDYYHLKSAERFNPIILVPESSSGPGANAATLDTITGGSTPAEDVSVLDFDPDASEYKDFKIALNGYNGGGLTATIIFSMTSDHDEGTPHKVRWMIAIRRIADDAEDINGAHSYAYNGVSAVVPSAVGEVSYEDITFTDGADMDSLADGEMAILRIYRDHDHADDNATGDAELQMIIIKET